MSQFRPIRPFFYKPVAVMGVPLRDWYITIAATVFVAVFFLIFWRTAFRIPIWMVFSLGSGFGLTSFFLWAHNSHKRGWIESSIKYYWREVIGNGQNLLAENAGRRKTRWLLDADGKTRKPKWLERANF